MGHYYPINDRSPLSFGDWNTREHLIEMFDKFLAQLLPDKKINPWTWDNCEIRPLYIFHLVDTHNQLNDRTFPDFHKFILDLYSIEPEDEFFYYWAHFTGFMDERSEWYTPEYKAQMDADFKKMEEEMDKYYRVRDEMKTV